MSATHYRNKFLAKLAKIKTSGRYRDFVPTARRIGEYPVVKTLHGRKIVWCSNDYLNVGHHPAVMQAAKDALNKYALGAGGTRNISGTTSSIYRLEMEIAKFHNKKAALVFNSGYNANSGSIAAIAKLMDDPIIFSDADNHASMIDGIQRSKAKKKIFKHNDIVHLEQLLKETPLEQDKFIVFESLYSMDGSTSPIKDIAELAKVYNAMTYIDEIHAVGLYGKGGRGLCEKENCVDDIDIIQAGFGKCLGTQGGYIVGDELLVDLVRLTAEPFIFTTSNSTVISEATRKSIDIVDTLDHEREIMFKNIDYLKKSLRDKGFTVMNPENTHIVPVFVGDPELCRTISAVLFDEYGHYIQPINYPTVPEGTERLRITPSFIHNEEMIDDLVHCLEIVFKDHHLLPIIPHH